MVDHEFAGQALHVKRDDLRTHRLVPIPPPELALEEGQALLRIDRFALTANNISYGVLGELLYWRFFPAPDGFARLPVWGFSEVVASRSPDAPVGTRVYGFLPLSTHLVITPRAKRDGFFDATPHRRQLPSLYNFYGRVPSDGDRDAEAMRALLEPLLGTAVALDDFLATHDAFGAGTVVLGSASSKTAISLAQLLLRRGGLRVVGLTSPARLDFVAGLDCYDAALSYDALEDLPATDPTVYVDMAGDGDVRARLHQHLGDALKYDAPVGISHWERIEAPAELPGPAPVPFFAPDWLAEMTKRLGRDGLSSCMAGGFAAVGPAMAGILSVHDARGAEAVTRIYGQALDGTLDATRGYMLSLWPAEGDAAAP